MIIAPSAYTSSSTFCTEFCLVLELELSGDDQWPSFDVLGSRQEWGLWITSVVMLKSCLQRVAALELLSSSLIPKNVTKCLGNAVFYSNKTDDGKTDLVTYKKDVRPAGGEKQFDEYTPSPFKQPGPRRYGYVMNYKTDGLLPRDGKPVRSLPPYRPKNKWDKKHALFGQNDYIDILGDGDVHPADLLTGPKWLIAFKGNERERLMRKMEWEGPRLRLMYPSEYNRMEKRIRYLTKLYNHKRKSRWAD
ncbi:39S ribosomal protein L51, mitochondrial-like [Elysia marginata]|uniref:Large ribosomal subunit protein mL51 n=1 Tax=Elysia marginata TaxID=1093978 RepID=A0AAV4F412_9GAST|nr:39S ribosomal protein L51, mitochondrial-like [Elysia marginata]